MSDLETVQDITKIASAVPRLASWAVDTTNEIASLRDEQARHRRAIDALTEQLDGLMTIVDPLQRARS